MHAPLLLRMPSTAPLEAGRSGRVPNVRYHRYCRGRYGPNRPASRELRPRVCYGSQAELRDRNGRSTAGCPCCGIRPRYRTVPATAGHPRVSAVSRLLLHRAFSGGRFSAGASFGHDLDAPLLAGSAPTAAAGAIRFPTNQFKQIITGVGWGERLYNLKGFAPFIITNTTTMTTTTTTTTTTTAAAIRGAGFATASFVGLCMAPGSGRRAKEAGRDQRTQSCTASLPGLQECSLEAGRLQHRQPRRRTTRAGAGRGPAPGPGQAAYDVSYCCYILLYYNLSSNPNLN